MEQEQPRTRQPELPFEPKRAEEGDEGPPLRSPNPYEEKLARRKERLEDRAERARAKADGEFARSQEAVRHIPLGQPILRGHHSERRHRRDLERSHAAMDRALEQSKRAEELEYRASRVGTGGISSDDPEAGTKLEAELEKLEARRELMKRVNREYRKGGWEAVTGLSDEVRERLKVASLRALGGKESPFPGYALRNLGANIRRVRGRIEELARSAEEPERETVTGPGYTIEHCKAENRIRFVFDSKPDEETRALLKGEAFRWARSIGAWQRKATPAGWAAAERVRLQLETSAGDSTGTSNDAPSSSVSGPDTLAWVREHDRNEVIARIRKALKARSERAWSVTGGRGTSYGGWIGIDAPPKRRTFENRPTGETRGDGLPVCELVDVGKGGDLMGPVDRRELARLLGFGEESLVPHQGVRIAAGHDYYAEFIDRAEGRPPSVIGEPYWD